VVLVPDPAYPIHRAGPILAGAEIYELPLTPAGGYLPDLDAIPPTVLNRAKAIVLNYPANPTTAVADAAFFAELARWAAHWGIWVIHDAAYSELAFDGLRPPSFLEAPGAIEVGIEFNSLSKTFNLAGCRIGYAVGNETLVRALKEIKGHLDYGTFLPIQRAAAFALRQPLEAARAAATVYQRRRDALVEALAAIGWDVPPPRATMFCWAPLPSGHTDSRGFALTLMERAGVIVTPGVGFGAGGEGFVRIALVQDEERLREAAARIAESGLLRPVRA
ncbi:MAG TPA: aminotransferase class I/II-fold pyridoxal phosphate-dependent enzyme, partial [Bacillota bacterium]